MSTRELFEARYRRIRAEYGSDIAALHYEFPHGYPQSRICGRLRQSLPGHMTKPSLGNLPTKPKKEKVYKKSLPPMYRCPHCGHGFDDPDWYHVQPYGGVQNVCPKCRGKIDVIRDFARKPGDVWK